MRNPVTLTKDIVRFCAEECKRQNVGPISVADMVDAYMLATTNTFHGICSENKFIVIYGKVEGVENLQYRTTPVRFANYAFAVNAESVSRAMEQLCVAIDGEIKVWDTLNDELARHFVKSFLDIHPFTDGNGRTAAIMYNWLRNTMQNPVTLPDFYGDNNSE